MEKEEQRQGILCDISAFNICSYDGNDGDNGSGCKMEVILGYWIGMDILANVFPFVN